MSTNLILLSLTLITNPVESAVYRDGTNFVQDTRHDVGRRYAVGYKKRGKAIPAFVFTEPLTNWFTRKIVNVIQPPPTGPAMPDAKRAALEAERDRANLERDRLQQLVDKYAEAERTRTNQPAK